MNKSILKHPNQRTPTSTLSRQPRQVFSPLRHVRLYQIDNFKKSFEEEYYEEIDDSDSEQEIEHSTKEIIETSQHTQEDSFVERRPLHDCSAQETNSNDCGQLSRKRKKTTKVGPVKKMRPCNAHEPQYYTVEKVLGRRYRNKKAEFLIKWGGYGHAENSWEPAFNFDKDLVREINKVLKN